MKAILTNRILVSPKSLPAGAETAIKEALTIPNIAKQQARKLDRWGWQQMSDTIPLWRYERRDGHIDLSLPRGFMHTLAEGMAHFGESVEIIDWRTWGAPDYNGCGHTIDLRPWQIPALNAILEHQQGIYKAPAGSGKTVTVLAAVRDIARQSLVIVNTKDILWQWQERAEQFLGADYPVGQVGDGVMDISPHLTIATAQTLHSRFDALELDGFFDIFSLVCLDECHHATAETYNYLLDRFSSRYRIGVSATPDKTGDFQLAINVLGPIFHTTDPEDVSSLQRPRVIRVPTRFRFGFHGHVNRWQRSNYGQMINALIRNEERNALIVEKILANRGHHQLVVSKRIEHLDILEAMLLDEGFSDPVLRLTGQDSNDHRQFVKAHVESTPCVVLSTLADEALDVPRLDRLYLVFPQRNAGLVTQQVGRVERVHPDKRDAIIYDFTDGNVGPLDAQWRVRRFDVYEPRGYRISTERVAA